MAKALMPGATGVLALADGTILQGYGVGAVGPVFGWRHDRDGRTTGWGGGVAPILFFGHDGTRRHAAVLPLFWWSRDSATGKQLTAVGPLYVRQDPRVHAVDVGILPFLHFGHEDHRAYAYVAPVFWFKKSPERTTVVLGPIYGSKAKNGDYDGGLAPLAFFPVGWQRVLAWSPFRGMLAAPVEALGGFVDPAQARFDLAVQAGWTAACFLLVAVLWKRGVARYGAFGA